MSGKQSNNNEENKMTTYYNTGKLTIDVSANGTLIRAGEFAAVSVEQDDDGLFVAICSGNKNVFLPFFDTDYESLVRH